MKFKNLDQNKYFIKSEAQRLGISVNAAYATYYSRLLLERLAQINYGLLVVKGSFSQYVHLGDLSRPVLDIDLSSLENHDLPLKLLYSTVYEASDDIVSFDINESPIKTANGVYKISVVVKIKYPDSYKEMKVFLNVDFKESNPVIFEIQYKPVMPLFKGDKKFFINTPSFEEHLAEKLFIVAHNRRKDIPNTRVKDFYDIYKLHDKSYDSDKFSLYFQTMLLMYEGSLNNINSDFLDNSFITDHLQLWENMKKKYEFQDQELELAEAVYYTKAVLNEQINKIRCGEFTTAARQRVRTINNI